jgi:dsRNA-specific ribonuclease
MSRSDAGAGRRNPGVIEERIGYTFNDRALLERALTRLAYTLEAGLPPRPTWTLLPPSAMRSST